MPFFSGYTPIPHSSETEGSFHYYNVESPTLTNEQAHEILSHIENARHLLYNYALISQNNVVPRRKSWWGRHCWPNKRRFLYRFVIIITVFIQVLNLTIITVIDTWPRHDTQEKDFLVASSVSMIALQLINLLFLILASGRLVKQIYRHSVNGLFLAQSYGATILLFAGLYTLTYRLEKHSWKFVSESFNDNPGQVFVLYAKFLFYSISTATLCGSDNVLPVVWYNCIFAGFQMLLSFCYFASILGSAMGHEGHFFFSQNANRPKSPVPTRNHRQGNCSSFRDGPGDISSILTLNKEPEEFHKKKRASSVSIGPGVPLVKNGGDVTTNEKRSSPNPSIQSYSAMDSSDPALLMDNNRRDYNISGDDDSGRIDRFYTDAAVHFVNVEESKKSNGGRNKP